ncbi:taurine dioxygenase [Swingsia samuiensis]|uniref:Taurine dioxygenase n=1 Tax=Swingsia samuiensis TaxID=1293412 RepID=A0A4Y6UJU3_9PROT|nr:taurine dioxygenase [Swingsia samuiensis]QDH16746.1 taurine dioxygenase [Swingsia samuiensis]
MTTKVLNTSENNVALHGEKPNYIHSLNVEPISPAIGAIIHNFDLSQPLTSTVLSQINELFLQYQVLFFRNQNLAPSKQRDFARAFGELHIHPVYPSLPDVPEAIILDTAQNDLKDNALWHIDVSFSPTPPLGAVLAARQLPQCGGDTLWASGTAAYRALSSEMKRHLEHLTAIHDFTRSFPLSRFGRTEKERELWEETRRKNPPVEHPVIRVHPETGERALYVNQGFTTEICGIERDESDALLNYLFQHISKPDFSLRWRWQDGDVAFWDNRVTQHYAIDDYRPHRRIMHRVTILGDKPVGPSIT